MRTPIGRARQQLNAAVRSATRRHVWFLHADTRLRPGALAALAVALAAAPSALHYFDLAFFGGWSAAHMALNAIGVWARSHLPRHAVRRPRTLP